MPAVVIYTRPWCGYCRRAKALLDARSVRYNEIDVDVDPELEREMIRKAGGRTTVPQIFIDERHIGGSDDLVALDRRGGLDALLEA